MTKKRLFLGLIVWIFWGVLISCGNEGGGKPDYEFPSGNPEPGEGDSGLEAQGWQVTDAFGELPVYLKVYKSPAVLRGKNAVAYIAVVDTEKETEFLILGNTSGSKTPAQFYDTETMKPAVIMNAGYFWDGNTVSMLCREGEILAPAQPVWQSDLTFYPTRGAFGIGNDGVYDVNWVYTVGDQIYAYPGPAQNDEKETPLREPSADFPKGGRVWNVRHAIGGGPVLIKADVYQNTYSQELFGDASGIGALANHPRSAIGITKDQKLIFFVCEGRNMTPGVSGLTLEDVACILKDLGCVEALNLDGGGSSCMLINGKETIKPSSNGVQRAVVTAIAVR